MKKSKRTENVEPEPVRPANRPTFREMVQRGWAEIDERRKIDPDYGRPPGLN